MAPKKKGNDKPEVPEVDGIHSQLCNFCVLVSASIRDDPSGTASDANPKTELAVEYGPPGTAETVHITLVQDTSCHEEAKALQAHHSCVLVVKDDLVRSLAPAYELLFLVTPAGQSTADSTVPAAAGQPGGTQLAVDISELLLGETRVKHEWPSEQRSLPEALTGTLEHLSITITTCKYSPEDSEVAHSEMEQIAFLPPGLHEHLCPVVLHLRRATSLPDQPATTAQLDSDCYRCCLKFRMPSSEAWNLLGAEPGAVWSENTTTSQDPPIKTRNLVFSQSHVLFACDLNVENFLEACKTQDLIIEVHDRDAKPVQRVIPMPYEEPAPEPEPVAAPPVVVPAKKGKGASAGTKEEPLPPEPEPAEPQESEYAPSVSEYVCAGASISLLTFARGGSRIEFDCSLLPFSTVGACNSGLTWRERPGLYMQAQSYLEGSIRCARPLTECTKDPAPLVFSRALFIMAHADSALFHALEDTVRVQNAHALGILDGPQGFLSPECQNSTDADTLHAVLGSQEHSHTEGLDEGLLTAMTMPAVLHKHLSRAQELSTTDLQTLATQPLDSSVERSATDDLLTGFHLTDGHRRIIVVEGLVNGAMNLVFEIVKWAQQDSPRCLDGGAQVNKAIKRKVLYSYKTLYARRTYHTLGADLWILKTRQSLKQLLKSPASYARGQVRPECKEALRRLAALESVQWARQLHDIKLWPSFHHLHALDRKLGGVLTPSDILGVESNQDTCKEDTQMLVGTTNVEASQEKDKDSAPEWQEGHSQNARLSESSQRMRRQTRTPPVDMQNVVFEMRLRQAAARREGRGLEELLEETKKMISATQDAAAPLRRAWQAWNPQRAALQDICKETDLGLMSLEETRATRHRSHDMAGTLQGDAKKYGWVQHKQSFMWPTPKLAGTYNRHPKRPDELRIEQLRQPWDDGAAPIDLDQHSDGYSVTAFDTSCAMKPPQLFDKDVKSIFIAADGEDGLDEQELQIIATEKDEWHRRVVVADTTFHRCKLRCGGQVEKYEGLLADDPQTLALKKVHVPPAPLSMFTEEKMESNIIERDGEAEMTTHATPFRSVLAKEKRAVHKPTLDQSWYGSLHDAHLQ